MAEAAEHLVPARTPRAQRAPDFLVVGAPKCGTTALDAYLREHPAIFMGRKEWHFFGSDLDEIWRQPFSGRRPTRAEYLGQFQDLGQATICGESSVWYLWSRQAAREIHECNPEAKIIVMLRNPVEMLPSLHSQFLYNAIEDIEDFGEAFAAEPERRAGRRIPPHNGPHPWRLFYREIVEFDVQLKRYLDTFGSSQVHVILFDDFTQRPETTFRETLEFLGVDPTFVPSFRVVNANKRVRSRWVRRIMFEIGDPSSRLRRWGTRLMPIHSVRSALLRQAIPTLRRVNTDVRPRPPLSEETRRAMAAEFAPGIRRLGDLLGRDLSSWCSI